MEKFIVVPEKIVFGGDCMARVNGKNVFIPYAIPGEKIEIEITKNLRDYDLAKITKIIEPSPHRTEPFCPFYQKCGGCNMQHIDIDHQRQLRKEMLADCFKREGLEIPEIQIISGNEKNYRSRIQLTDGSFNEKDSNNKFNLDQCPVATIELNEYLKNYPVSKRPAGRVHFFADSRVEPDSNQIMPKVIIADEIQRQKYQNNITPVTKGSGNKKIKNKVKPRFSGTMATPQNNCVVNLKNHRLQFNVQGFFQSNMEVLEKTIDAIMFNIKGENVLDMYAGSGTFSVFLAEAFKKVYLVEHNRDALVNAEINLAGTNHESYGLSGEKWIKEAAQNIISKSGPFEAVVIDPPRSGMEKAVRDWLCTSKTPQIRSVSCDPSTHARDAKKLIESGYKLTKLYLLDFYPQTSHIESLSYFEYEN